MHQNYFAAVIGARRGLHSRAEHEAQPIAELSYYHALELERLHYDRRRHERLEELREKRPPDEIDEP